MMQVAKLEAAHRLEQEKVNKLEAAHRHEVATRNQKEIEGSARQEKDAQVWAVPFIRITTGKFALFLMRLQPRPLSSSFYMAAKHQKTLMQISRTIQVSYTYIASILGSVVHERNT